MTTERIYSFMVQSADPKDLAPDARARAMEFFTDEPFEAVDLTVIYLNGSYGTIYAECTARVKTYD